jgi:hypothetical protein
MANRWEEEYQKGRQAYEDGGSVKDKSPVYDNDFLLGFIDAMANEQRKKFSQFRKRVFMRVVRR